MKKLIKMISGILAAVSMLTLSVCAAAAQNTPDQITISSKNGDSSFSSYAITYSDTPVSEDSEGTLSTTGELKLFGALPIKEVDIRFTDRQIVTLGGQPFGIRLYTDGLVVSKIADVPTSKGIRSPAKDAGIQCGDIILQAGNEKLRTNEQLMKICESSNGEPILLKCRHDGDDYTTSIVPAPDSELKLYRMGLWVRDSCAGIGTITFTDEKTKTFAGLGHGIYDNESGSLMPLSDGDIVPADILSADKGTGGNPGSLCGVFSAGEPIGLLKANSECGLYGTYTDFSGGTKAEVAFRQEVTKGKAQIISTVDGSKPIYYDIEIEDISYDNSEPSKNMIIKVTDSRLIEKTGGIVRGMSGSPIIQNGRLAGAVTHVFINDPSHGYAVFAENMADYHNNMIQKQQ